MTNQSADGEALMAVDPERASAVAKEYDALQGLAPAVMGLGLVGGAATDQPVIWILLAAGLVSATNGWYARRFGTVKPTADRAAWAALCSVVAGLLFLGGYALDRALQGPVLLTLLAVALSLGVGQYLLLRRMGLTVLHKVVYVLVALAAGGPLVGLGRGNALLPYILLVSGLALVVIGLVDHRRLVRALSPVDRTYGDER